LEKELVNNVEDDLTIIQATKKERKGHWVTHSSFHFPSLDEGDK
jgi:hypothetical protein